ncbi:MAG: YciI family protein [Pseudonocardiaceae bacterium]|nr:YciI family protein [Pseudonocardiaceae bacterium]
MRYMLLLYGCDDRPQPGDPGFEEALARVNAFAEECHRRGTYVAGDPLRRSSTATTVRVEDGKTLITDGPFAETHEQLGGYYILDCRNLDEALELAALCPMAQRGPVEVRPLDEIPGAWRGPADIQRAAVAEG